MLAADEMFERREIVAREEEIVNALNSLVVQKHDYKAVSACVLRTFDSKIRKIIIDFNKL